MDEWEKIEAKRYGERSDKFLDGAEVDLDETKEGYEDYLDHAKENDDSVARQQIGDSQKSLDAEKKALSYQQRMVKKAQQSVAADSRQATHEQVTQSRKTGGRVRKLFGSMIAKIKGSDWKATQAEIDAAKAVSRDQKHLSHVQERLAQQDHSMYAAGQSRDIGFQEDTAARQQDVLDQAKHILRDDEKQSEEFFQGMKHKVKPPPILKPKESLRQKASGLIGRKSQEEEHADAYSLMKFGVILFLLGLWKDFWHDPFIDVRYGLGIVSIGISFLYLIMFNKAARLAQEDPNAMCPEQMMVWAAFLLETVWPVISVNFGIFPQAAVLPMWTLIAGYFVIFSGGLRSDHFAVPAIILFVLGYSLFNAFLPSIGYAETHLGQENLRFASDVSTFFIDSLKVTGKHTKAAAVCYFDRLKLQTYARGIKSDPSDPDDPCYEYAQIFTPFDETSRTVESKQKVETVFTYRIAQFPKDPEVGVRLEVPLEVDIQSEREMVTRFECELRESDPELKWGQGIVGVSDNSRIVTSMAGQDYHQWKGRIYFVWEEPRSLGEHLIECRMTTGGETGSSLKSYVMRPGADPVRVRAENEDLLEQKFDNVVEPGPVQLKIQFARDMVPIDPDDNPRLEFRLVDDTGSSGRDQGISQITSLSFEPSDKWQFSDACSIFESREGKYYLNQQGIAALQSKIPTYRENPISGSAPFGSCGIEFMDVFGNLDLVQANFEAEARYEYEIMKRTPSFKFRQGINSEYVNIIDCNQLAEDSNTVDSFYDGGVDMSKEEKYLYGYDLWNERDSEIPSPIVIFSVWQHESGFSQYMSSGIPQNNQNKGPRGTVTSTDWGTGQLNDANKPYSEDMMQLYEIACNMKKNMEKSFYHLNNDIKACEHYISENNRASSSLLRRALKRYNSGRCDILSDDLRVVKTEPYVEHVVDACKDHIAKEFGLEKEDCNCIYTDNCTGTKYTQPPEIIREILLARQNDGGDNV